MLYTIPYRHLHHIIIPHENIVWTQAEYEQYTIDQGREMEALHQQHKAETHVLKMRVQELEASFADADRDREVQHSCVRFGWPLLNLSSTLMR